MATAECLRTQQLSLVDEGEDNSKSVPNTLKRIKIMLIWSNKKLF